MGNRQKALVLFLITQIITLILLFQKKQIDYAFETIIVISGSLFVAYINCKKKLSIPLYVVIIVLISLSCHTIGGQLLNLYVDSSIFDKYLHIFGTYSFTLLIYFYLRINELSLGKWQKFFFTMMIGLSLATIYELMEFATDYFIKPTVPAQQGLLDTDLDLLSDLAGALLAAFHISRK